MFFSVLYDIFFLSKNENKLENLTAVHKIYRTRSISTQVHTYLWFFFFFLSFCDLCLKSQTVIFCRSFTQKSVEKYILFIWIRIHCALLLLNKRRFYVSNINYRVCVKIVFEKKMLTYKNVGRDGKRSSGETG